MKRVLMKKVEKEFGGMNKQEYYKQVKKLRKRRIEENKKIIKLLERIDFNAKA